MPASDLALFADRVRARLGDSAVLAAGPVESHLPERAVVHVPFTEAAESMRERPDTGIRSRVRPERPIRLFRQPEPIEVMRRGAGGPAAQFPLAPRLLPRRPRRRARTHRAGMVARARRTAPTRDYFRVEDEDGRRYWLYRQGLYGARKHCRAGSCMGFSHERAFASVAYAEFAVQSNFSFLRGASKPEELVVTARLLGLSAIGLADRNTVAGVVRAWQQAEGGRSFAYHPGCRLVFSDGTPDMLAYPQDRKGWGHLCRMLTAGQCARGKREGRTAFCIATIFSNGATCCRLPSCRISTRRRTRRWPCCAG